MFLQANQSSTFTSEKKARQGPMGRVLPRSCLVMENRRTHFSRHVSKVHRNASFSDRTPSNEDSELMDRVTMKLAAIDRHSCSEVPFAMRLCLHEMHEWAHWTKEHSTFTKKLSGRREFHANTMPEMWFTKGEMTVRHDGRRDIHREIRRLQPFEWSPATSGSRALFTR